MRGIVLASLMIVGILVFAGTALGVTYYKYDEATTTIILGDGLTCTIDGKEVKNGDTITSELRGGYLNAHVESNTPVVIGYVGLWASDGDTEKREGDSSVEVTSYDIKIPFNHGSYNGKLQIWDLADDASGNLITLVLHFDESKMTVWFSFANDYRHDGETIHVLGYDVFELRHVDKKSHTFSWDGTWSNDLGQSASLKGSQYADDIVLYIDSFHEPYGPSTGDITFTVED